MRRKRVSKTNRAGTRGFSPGGRCIDCPGRGGCPMARCVGGGATGAGVDIKCKKDLAVEFINLVRAMEPSALNGLIVKEAGEELAQFFLQYSENLISKDPARVLENTSSLMLMGYLIRCHEERTQPSPQM